MASLALVAIATVATAGMATPIIAVATMGAAMAGGYIDSKIFAASGQATAPPATNTPRLDDLRLVVATEGKPIPRVYGATRIGGEIIWGTDFEEEIITTKSTSGEASGGKGGIGGGGTPTVETTTITYNYYCSFALAVCEGEIDGIGRVWFDGKEVSCSSGNVKTTRIETRVQRWTTNIIETGQNFRETGKVYSEKLTTTYEYNSTRNVGVENVSETIGEITETSIKGTFAVIVTFVVAITEIVPPQYLYRLYRGTETQLPDGYMVAQMGIENAPAYRGTAYMMFERMFLEKVGNRIPQITVEVFRRPPAFWPSTLPEVRHGEAILKQIARDFGIGGADIGVSYDVGTLYGPILGYAIDNVTNFRAATQPMEVAARADVIETGDSILVRARGSNTIITLSSDDLVDMGISDGGPPPEGDDNKGHFTLVRDQETDIPALHILSYIDKANDYNRGTVGSRQYQTTSTKVANSSMPIVTRDGYAQDLSDVLLREPWAAREKFKFTLPPSYAALQPGDVLRTTFATQDGDFIAHDVKITSITDGVSREVEGIRTELALYNSGATSPYATRPVPETPVPMVFGKSDVEQANLPILRDEDYDVGAYAYARIQTPHPSSVVLYRSPTTINYTLNAILHGAAYHGIIQGACSEGVIGRKDMANSILVSMRQGALLYSATESQFLDGENLCAVKDIVSGSWEVMQFRDATLIEQGIYVLKTFLRGQRGTLSKAIHSGDEFVLINNSVASVNLTNDNVNVPYSWRFGPSGSLLESSIFQSRNFSYVGEGLKCYAPCNAVLSKVGSNLVISWIRRSRKQGDSWNNLDVPQPETSEQYVVRIYGVDEVSIVRTYTVGVPSLIYPSADYTVDFGTQPVALKVSITQKNEYAEGRALVVVLGITRIS